MKYGLYYFKETPTLGDDIWAYATSRYYPHIDYLIDNTSIYKFHSDNMESVASILSAFIEPRNCEYAFLPPENIIPLFQGSYFRSTIWEYIENSPVREYLKAYEPIGCRSQSNVKKFRELGIQASFTGCITMTIPPFKKNKQKYICCVDVPQYVVEYIKELVGDFYDIKVLTHEMWKWGENYVNIHSSLTMEERFEIVEQYLQTYANAHCVVTSKLHCAIPCLTQNTPVLFALPQSGVGIADMEERIGDFLEYFNVAYYEEFMSKQVSYDFKNPPPNSNSWEILKSDIDSVAKDFINSCESGDKVEKSIYSGEYHISQIEVLEKKIMQLKQILDCKNENINQLMKTRK